MPVAEFPQELIDHVVDDLATDKTSLLLLLRTAHIFGDRCRTYLYRNVCIQTTSTGDLTDHSLLLYDHLTSPAATGRFVSRVEYRFGTSAIPPAPVWHIATITPPPSLKPGDGVPLSPKIPELARRMPNVQEVYLDGFDCSPNSIPQTSVRSILPPSTESLTKLSIHHSCWAGDAVKELYYFLCSCPRLTSLELTNVVLVSNATGALSSANALACPSIVNLTVTDRDHTLFYLIPAGYLSLRKSLRRFFITSELDSVLSPNKGWPLIHKTIRFLGDRLTVLFISPPYNLMQGLILPILNVPHVVISCRQVMLATPWLQSIKDHAQDLNRQKYRLKNLDVSLNLYDLSGCSPSRETSILPALGTVLNSFARDCISVRIIVATEPSRSGQFNDGSYPRLKDPMGVMRDVKRVMEVGERAGTPLFPVKSDMDDVHLYFMEDGRFALKDD